MPEVPEFIPATEEQQANLPVNIPTWREAMPKTEPMSFQAAVHLQAEDAHQIRSR